MNQLRVKYHQLKIDMFALYRATMDNRGVKVYQAEQALSKLDQVKSSDHSTPLQSESSVSLPVEDADYVQSLADMESRFQLGPASYRGRLRRFERLPPPVPNSRRKAIEQSLQQLSEETPTQTLHCPDLARDSGPGAAVPFTEQTLHWCSRELSESRAVFRCYRCSIRFDTAAGLFQHWTDESNCCIICLFCKTEFVTNSKHDNHLLSCQEIKCSGCAHLWNSMEDYRTHVLVCCNKEICEPEELLNASLICPYCEKKFTFFSKFKDHIKQYHEPEHFMRFGVKVLRKYRPCAPLYQCGKCDRRFSKLNEFKLHQNEHKQSTRYHCNHCSKSFRFAGTLERHMKVHVKPLVSCEICGKEFPKTKLLLIHLKENHDQECFMCPFCSENCNGFNEFVAHKKQIHNTKCHTCLVCKQSFNKKSKLQEHVDSNDSCRGFECQHCQRSYSSNEALADHVFRCHRDALMYYGQGRMYGDMRDSFCPVNLENRDGFEAAAQNNFVAMDTYSSMPMNEHHKRLADVSNILAHDDRTKELTTFSEEGRGQYQVCTDENEGLVAQYYTSDGRSAVLPINLCSDLQQEQSASFQMNPNVSDTSHGHVQDFISGAGFLANNSAAGVPWSCSSTPLDSSTMVIRTGESQVSSVAQAIPLQVPSQSMPSMDVLLSNECAENSAIPPNDVYEGYLPTYCFAASSAPVGQCWNATKTGDWSAECSQQSQAPAVPIPPCSDVASIDQLSSKLDIDSFQPPIDPMVAVFIPRS